MLSCRSVVKRLKMAGTTLFYRRYSAESSPSLRFELRRGANREPDSSDTVQCTALHQRPHSQYVGRSNDKGTWSRKAEFRSDFRLAEQQTKLHPSPHERHG